MNKRNMKYSFDLKGSIINRKTKYKSSILKDVNFLELNVAQSDKQVVHINEKSYDSLISTINQDADFLNKNGMMDYSLLLIVERVVDEKKEEEDAEQLLLPTPQESAPIPAEQSSIPPTSPRSQSGGTTNRESGQKVLTIEE